MSKEYYVREILRKKVKSKIFFIISAFAYVIFINILITLTNNISAQYRNAVSIAILVLFGIIFFLMFERIMSVYVYLLSKESIAFAKKTGKRESIILEVDFKEIIVIKDISEMNPNADVKNTYYFTYGEGDASCKFCEFKKNSKLYRFVFCPNERIMRVLERKMG
jgi:hypothetical protein